MSIPVESKIGIFYFRRAVGESYFLNSP